MKAKTLKELAGAGVLSHVVALPDYSGGWTVFAVYDGHIEPACFLETTRGEVRRFATLDAVYRFLVRIVGSNQTVMRVAIGELLAAESET